MTSAVFTCLHSQFPSVVSGTISSGGLERSTGKCCKSHSTWVSWLGGWAWLCSARRREAGGWGLFFLASRASDGWRKAMAPRQRASSPFEISLPAARSRLVTGFQPAQVKLTDKIQIRYKIRFQSVAAVIEVNLSSQRWEKTTFKKSQRNSVMLNNGFKSFLTFKCKMKCKLICKCCLQRYPSCSLEDVMRSYQSNSATVMCYEMEC